MDKKKSLLYELYVFEMGDSSKAGQVGPSQNDGIKPGDSSKAGQVSRLRMTKQPRGFFAVAQNDGKRHIECRPAKMG